MITFDMIKRSFNQKKCVKNKYNKKIFSFFRYICYNVACEVMGMTDKETLVVVLDIISLLLVNMMMFKKKKALYESKALWVYHLGVKATIVLPAFFTGLQLYVFAFGYVAKVGCTMSYLVLYCYIGYLLLVGFILFMEEYQVNLLRFMSCFLLVYQCYMAYQLINNQAVIKILLDSPMNPFRYGDAMGTFLCLLGPILSFAGLLTCFHYWKVNNKRDFTK